LLVIANAKKESDRVKLQNANAKKLKNHFLRFFLGDNQRVDKFILSISILLFSNIYYSHQSIFFSFLQLFQSDFMDVWFALLIIFSMLIEASFILGYILFWKRKKIGWSIVSIYAWFQVIRIIIGNYQYASFEYSEYGYTDLLIDLANISFILSVISLILLLTKDIRTQFSISKNYGIIVHSIPFLIVFLSTIIVWIYN
jgi:hypothetical protein